MVNITEEKIIEWSKSWHKGPLGDAVLDAVESNKDVVVLAADLAKAVGVYECIEYEGQYYNLGICEQNMISVACGLAKEGKIPVASSFVPFLTLRALEQIRTGAAYMNLNVKMIGTNAGLRGGKAGTSHYGLEDITVMRSIPGVTVLSPSDGLCMYKAIRAMMDHPGPVYLRVAGLPQMPIHYKSDFDYEIGKAIRLREGEGVAIFATGPMVGRALKAAEVLDGKGINASVYDFHTVKPLDRQAVLDEAGKAKLIVTLEENTVMGGFGGAVAELLAQSGTDARLKIVGIIDEFLKIASYEDQLEKCGLLPEQIVDTVQLELK
jgi:transketolase